MKKADNKWKDVAIKLYNAINRVAYFDCGDLDHSGGFYHEHNEECPIVKQIEEAFEEYQKLIKH